MSSSVPLPVVLGSSFSGLLVSLTLSKQGIRHVLVGGPPPPEQPRLGESMIETTGPELWRLLGPRYRQFFFKKNHISLFDGERVSLIQIGDPRRSLDDVARRVVAPDRIRMPGFRTLLMHVDRSRLDPVLYQEATARTECRFLKSFVREIRMDDDRVSRIELEDGEVLDGDLRVFDATGHHALVARAAGVDATPVSPAQRVGFRHRLGGDAEQLAQRWWAAGTNLIRLHRDVDGFSGTGWFIPLGDRISLGISVDAATPALGTPEALCDALDAALARRGIALAAHYPDAGPAQGLTHAYTLRDRSFGDNWMLVGGTYLQSWFPSSTGVWTTTAAAGLASAFIDDPEATGHRYQRTVYYGTLVHPHMAHLVHEGFDDDRSLSWFWGRWLSFIPHRLSQYMAIVNDDLTSRPLGHSLMRRGGHIALKRPWLHQLVWSRAIRIERPGQLADQGAAIADYFAPSRFRRRNVLQMLRRLGPGGWPSPWTLEQATRGAR